MNPQPLLLAVSVRTRAVPAAVVDPGEVLPGRGPVNMLSSGRIGEHQDRLVRAASDTGYATRPVQLFYALSQAAGRSSLHHHMSIIRFWKISGHGLTANIRMPPSTADVLVTATKSGLFPAVASALGIEALVADESVALRELWPLLPETVDFPLTTEVMFPALLFSQDGWPKADSVTQPALTW